MDLKEIRCDNMNWIHVALYLLLLPQILYP